MFLRRGESEKEARGRSVGRASQAGMLIGAAAASKSFERTLMPRKTPDQGIVTGLSVALTYVTTATFQDLIESAAAFMLRGNGDVEEDRLRRATMLADLVALGSGAVLESRLKQQENESIGRAAMRTTGAMLRYAGLAGFSVGFTQDLLDVVDSNPKRTGGNRTLGVAVLGGGVMALYAEYRRRRGERRYMEEDEEEGDVSPFLAWNTHAGRSLLVGTGVTGALGAIAAGERVLSVVTGRALERGLSGSPRFWHLAGHAGAMAALGSLAYAGLDHVYQDVEAGTGKIEPAFSKAPDSAYVSGSTGSKIPWRTLGREGRRHVLTVLPRDVISEVMGVPAVADPIRVYVGLESGRSEMDRVALAMEELKRTGAFERELLVAVSPTGTGYVNYVTIESCEYFTLGNCATVTLQYSKRPSPMSMDRVWEGRKQFRMLLAAIRRELYKLDPMNRPRLVVFGESLGAHTSQDAFLNEGTQGLEDAAVERALWIGSPHLSKWKTQVLGEHRPDVNKDLIVDVDNFGEIEELTDDVRQKLRYVMITHHNDGVGLFGADLAIQQPVWLGEPELRPPAIPKWMRWVPIITAVQTAIDMKNAMNVVPGEFVANGHDYRADLARFVREVYHLNATDAQLASVEAALRKYEILRKEMLDALPTPTVEQEMAPGQVETKRAA